MKVLYQGPNFGPCRERARQPYTASQAFLANPGSLNGRYRPCEYKSKFDA